MPNAKIPPLKVRCKDAADMMREFAVLSRRLAHGLQQNPNAGAGAIVIAHARAEVWDKAALMIERELKK